MKKSTWKRTRVFEIINYYLYPNDNLDTSPIFVKKILSHITSAIDDQNIIKNKVRLISVFHKLAKLTILRTLLRQIKKTFIKKGVIGPFGNCYYFWQSFISI